MGSTQYVQPQPSGNVGICTDTATMNITKQLEPVVFPLKTRLRDGTRILIRPLQLEDTADLLRGFQKLSMDSRRFRFLSPIRKLSKYQLTSLVEVDQINHVAIHRAITIGIATINCHPKLGGSLGGIAIVGKLTLNSVLPQIGAATTTSSIK